MSTPPKHRHEMTLRVGGNDNDELVRRLRRVADDIELQDIDGPREVVSSDGYWFTTQHYPDVTTETYATELRAWAERKRAAAREWVQGAEDALAEINATTEENA